MFAPARFPALALPEDVGGMLFDDGSVEIVCMPLHAVASAARPGDRGPRTADDPGIGSKSKKKPPTAIILGNESRRRRDTAGAPRDAALRWVPALPRWVPAATWSRP